jgi:predicted ATPase
VITGGPGAGKTAVLEMARRSLCRHVLILPEAAGIVFGGGFPRRSGDAARRGAQRAIFHIQAEMERLHLEEGLAAIVLCDRGTLDGLAYWPGTTEVFFADVGIDAVTQLVRYQAVIHLRTPSAAHGYDHSNPLRIEDADQANRIDELIERAWRRHGRRTIIDSAVDFPTKANQALAAIGAELPECCNPART